MARGSYGKSMAADIGVVSEAHDGLMTSAMLAELAAATAADTDLDSRVEVLERISTAAPSHSTTGAVDWYCTTLPNTKRQWIGKVLRVALTATPDQKLIDNMLLPDSMKLSQVYFAPPTLVGANTNQINVAVRGKDNTFIRAYDAADDRYFQVAASTIDGANLSAKTTYVDLLMFMMEI